LVLSTLPISQIVEVVSKNITRKHGMKKSEWDEK